MGIENPVHLLFIAVVALVVLGPKRLPELARALGKGMREFRQAMGAEGEDEADAAQPQETHRASLRGDDLEVHRSSLRGDDG
jgi:sec-independent protein translocase protein TatA